jgi:chaperonin cofactor prefoldin
MTLSRANEELSIRLAGSEVKVQALTSQMEESEAKANELQVSFTVFLCVCITV